MPLPPPGCWACGAVPSKEDIALGAVLHPREEREGGPWTRMACPGCGAEGALEQGPAEGPGPVLAPPGAVGADVPAVASFLDGRRGRDLRRRAREWMERYGAGLEALRAASPRETAPPPPAPRGGRDRKASGGRAKEAPPPSRLRPVQGLPSTPEEARAVLGVGPRAARKEVDSAFRKASRKCHPDLVAHLDEDFQRLAHEKFLRLKRAHDILTR